MDKSELIKNAHKLIAQEGLCNSSENKMHIMCDECPLENDCPKHKDASTDIKYPELMEAAKAWLAKNDTPSTLFKDLQTAIIEAAKGLKSSGAFGALQKFEKAISRLNIDKTDTDPIKKGRWLRYDDKWYYLIDVATYTNHPSPEGSAYVLYKGHRYCLPEYIEITDALACSRVQFGPVWVVAWDSKESEKAHALQLSVVVDSTYPIRAWSPELPAMGFKFARLATPEEIDAAGIKEES